MKIYFCDGCNESIPLADIQAGQATTIKGKLFCRTCIPPGGVGAAGGTPVTVQRGAGPAVWLVLVALLIWMASQQFPLPRSVTGADGAAHAEFGRGEELRRLTTAESEVARLTGAREDFDRRLTFLRGDLDTLRASAADTQRAADLAHDRMDVLERGQAEIGQLIEKLAFQEHRTRSLEARIDTLADVLSRHDVLLSTGMVSAGLGAEAAQEPRAASTAAPVDATLLAQLEALRKALLDRDPGQRFAAVDRISKERLRQLAPELVVMLGDEDGFVRILAMEALGDFGHVEAVPALLALLDDPSGQIRKTAGQQLVRLTGYDPGFDPAAARSEREKAVRLWKERLGLK